MRTLTMDALTDLDIILRVARDLWEKHGSQTVTIEDYSEGNETRSQKQNRLAFLWYKFIAVYLDDETAEDKRAYCKLHFGVPIRRENEKFREVYDRVLRPLTYGQKLEIMVGAIDFPVTRDMSVKEMSRFLEAIEVFFAGIGVVLPRPDDLYFDSLGIKRK